MIFLPFVIVLLITWIWRRRHHYYISYQLPGPPLALPFLGNIFVYKPFTYEKDKIKNVTSKFLKSDPISRVWFGPMLVIGINKPEYIQTILNNRFEKGYFYYSIEEFLGNSLLTGPVSIWKKNRKMINTTFHKEILKSFIGEFQQSFQETIDTIQDHQSNRKEILDIYSYVQQFAFSATSATLMENLVDINDFREHLEETLQLMSDRMLNPFVYFNVTWYLTNASKRLRQLRNMAFEVLHEMITKKFALLKNINSVDVFTNKRKRLLEHLVGHEAYSDQQIKEETSLMIIASTDTISNGITLCLYMLAMHKEIQDKVVDEICTVLEPSETIGNEHLRKFEYLERVIKETLRLFPSVPGINRYMDEDIDLDTYKIPQGTEVIISPFFLHRNPQYWPNPLKFDPDRFLPEEIAKRHPYCYIPFSAGARNCIGLQYAMRIMKFFVASFLRVYKVDTKVKSVEEIDVSLNIVMTTKTKHPLELQPRK